MPNDTYQSLYTGEQIDESIRQVKRGLSNASVSDDIKSIINYCDSLEHNNLISGGVSYTWNTDGSCHISGTASATSFCNLYGSKTSLPNVIKPGGIYEVKITSPNVALIFYDWSSGSNNPPGIAVIQNESRIIKMPESITGIIIRLWMPKGTVIDETVYPIISPPCETLDSLVDYSHKDRIIEHYALLNYYYWGITDNGLLDGSYKPSDNQIAMTEWLRVSSGDIIHIKTGNLNHALGIAERTGNGTYKYRRPVIRIGIDEDILVDKDGFFQVRFYAVDENANNAPRLPIIPLDEFTGGVSIERHASVLKTNTEALNTAINAKKLRDYWSVDQEHNPPKGSVTQVIRAHNSEPDNNLATFVHVSDIHGDGWCFANACKVADYIDATAILNSGDTVYKNDTDDFSFVTKTLDNCSVPFIECIGNHDSHSRTPEQQYIKYINPFVTNYGYTLPSGITNPTYYYKDFPSKKIRIIVVNQFEYFSGDNANPNASPRCRRYMSQEQTNWLISVLQNVPNDYGILIVSHFPEYVCINNKYTKFNDKFYGSYTSDTTYGFTLLRDIIDAFIAKASINGTYINPGPGDNETYNISVNANFSNRSESAEFIAFLNGHAHSDRVGYVYGSPNGTTQLQLGITCTNSWTNRNQHGGIIHNGTSNNPYLTELSDLNRNDESNYYNLLNPIKQQDALTKDAFNVYSIDRKEKTIRITRIGANQPTCSEEKRDFMIIPYANVTEDVLYDTELEYYDSFGPIMKVAESYLHAAYDAGSRLRYYTWTGMYKDEPGKTREENVQYEGVNAIQCSEFVQACLHGIFFNKSRYVKDTNTKSFWAFTPDSSASFAGNCCDDYMIAANLAKYCYSKGWLHEFELERPMAIKTGDILFYTGGSDGWNHISHVALCLAPYEQAYWTVESVSGNRIVDGQEVGVTIKLRKHDERGIAYYARIPLTPAIYKSFLVDDISGHFIGSYEGHARIIDSVRQYSPYLSPGIYTMVCEDEGTAPIVYLKAYYDGGPSSGVNYDCYKVGNKCYLVFYAELPIKSIDIRSYPRTSGNTPTTGSYNVTGLRIYRGYRPPEE